MLIFFFSSNAPSPQYILYIYIYYIMAMILGGYTPGSILKNRELTKVHRHIYAKVGYII